MQWKAITDGGGPVRVALRIWKSSCWQIEHTAFGSKRIPAIFAFTLCLIHSIQTAQSLVQLRHIGGQNGVASLTQLQLQPVVVQHVHQLLLELRNLHAVRNTLHQCDCIDVLSRAVQQRYNSLPPPIATSHELRLHDRVPHEIVPQVAVLPLLDELQRHVHIAQLLNDHLQRTRCVSQTRV